jgi:hypothetical protein
MAEMPSDSMKNQKAARRLLERVNAQPQHLRDTIGQTRALVMQSQKILEQRVPPALPRGEPDRE